MNKYFNRPIDVVDYFKQSVQKMEENRAKLQQVNKNYLQQNAQPRVSRFDQAGPAAHSASNYGNYSSNGYSSGGSYGASSGGAYSVPPPQPPTRRKY